MRSPLRISSLVLVACCGGSGVVTLASGQTPGNIAVDANSVYWSDHTDGISSIRRVPIGGGTPTIVFSGPVTHIAADRANLYWVGPDAVMKLSSAGGSPFPLAKARSGIRVAVDGSDVFWSDADGVHKVDQGGAAATTLFAGTVYLTALAASGGSVFFLKQAACPPCGFDVVKVSSQGGSPVTLFTETGPGFPDALNVDASSVYWGNENRGTVSKVPVAGGPPTTLFARDPGGGAQYTIGGIAADVTGVYSGISDFDGHGSLIRIAPQGDVALFGATTLADDQLRPGSVVLDGANVYWSTAGTRVNQIVRGTICKLRK